MTLNDFLSEGGAMHSGVQKVVASTNMPADTAKVVDEARDLDATIMFVPITFAEVLGELGSEPYESWKRPSTGLGGTHLRVTPGTQRRFCASAEASRPWIDVGQGRC
jgi:hypothetical protein